MSHKVEGLLFDLGGVVIDIDFEQALQCWKQWTALPIETLRYRFQIDEAYKKHERDTMNSSEYFGHLRSVLELDAPDSEIAKGWNAIFLGEISETVDDIRAVKEQMPCFAFTNSNPAHQVFWTINYKRVVDSFHQIFVSSELGLRKPECGAFEAIAETTGMNLSEMLFFDDSEENVKKAKELGMQAVHVKNHVDVKQALINIGAL